MQPTNYSYKDSPRGKSRCSRSLAHDSSSCEEDALGNLWCGSCRQRLLLINEGEKLGFPALFERLKVGPRGVPKEGKMLIGKGGREWGLYALYMQSWLIADALFYLDGGIRTDSPVKKKVDGEVQAEADESAVRRVLNLPAQINEKGLSSDDQALVELVREKTAYGHYIYCGQMLHGEYLMSAIIRDLLAGQREVHEWFRYLLSDDQYWEYERGHRAARRWAESTSTIDS